MGFEFRDNCDRAPARNYRDCPPYFSSLLFFRNPPEREKIEISFLFYILFTKIFLLIFTHMFCFWSSFLHLSFCTWRLPHSHSIHHHFHFFLSLLQNFYSTSHFSSSFCLRSNIFWKLSFLYILTIVIRITILFQNKKEREIFSRIKKGREREREREREKEKRLIDNYFSWCLAEKERGKMSCLFLFQCCVFFVAFLSLSVTFISWPFLNSHMI